MTSSLCLFRETVRLVPYAQEHDERTVAWLNDPFMRQTFGLTHPVSVESHRRWIESASNVLAWAILDRTGTHHGNILLHLTPRHASAYLQMYLGEAQARGQGLGWNALAAVLTHAFEQLDLHRIWLHTLPDNQAASGLYRKAGFVEEGIERESILRDGEFQDQRRWSILAQDWLHPGKSSHL